MSDMVYLPRTHSHELLDEILTVLLFRASFRRAARRLWRLRSRVAKEFGNHQIQRRQPTHKGLPGSQPWDVPVPPDLCVRLSGDGNQVGDEGVPVEVREAAAAFAFPPSLSLRYRPPRSMVACTNSCMFARSMVCSISQTGTFL